MNKYNARKTDSKLCGRTFDSMAEARRGEELRLLEMAGEIKNLQYQIPFVLSVKPSVKIVIDFAYLQNNRTCYEDVKGMMTPACRIKLAWLKKDYGIEVKLTK